MGEIFYFSGTGNSLMVAKDLSKEMKFSIRPISYFENNISIKTDNIIGIVFPVYNQTYPYIVKRFINKIEGIKDKYIFSIATYGNSLEISLKKIDKDLENLGGKISLGFGVKMPYNYLLPSFKIKDFYNNFKLKEHSNYEINYLIDNWKIKKENIIKMIKNKESNYIESKNDFFNKIKEEVNLTNTLQKNTWLKIGGFKGKSNLPMQEAVNLMDNSFYTDTKCNGCGLCKKICPVNNISITKFKPLWKHHCEQCFACLQWCPNKAIQFGNNTKNNKRYQNPKITIKEMIQGVFYEYEK